MSYFVYILRSERSGRFYVGSTHDVRLRLQHHNDGWSPSTKPYRPWVVAYVEEFSAKPEALQRERQIKRMKSRTYIERLIAGGRPDPDPRVPSAAHEPLKAAGIQISRLKTRITLRLSLLS